MFSTFRSRFILTFAIAMLPAFVLIVFIGVEQRAREFNNARANALRHAETLSVEVERSVDSVAELLEALALRSAISARDVDSCNELFDSITTSVPAYKDISFFAADTGGDILCSSATLDASGPAVNIADRGYFQRVLAGASLAVGEYQIGRVTGVANIVYARPVFSGGELSAVVLASVPLEVLSEAIASLPRLDGAVYRLLDRNGTVLVTNLEGETLGEYGAQSGLTASVDEISGTEKLSDVDDERRLYGFTPVGDFNSTGLTVAVGIPTSVAYGQINRDMVRNLGLLGLVALAATLAVWIGTAFLVRQTRRLTADVQSYARGETSHHLPKERGGVSEITALHNAFGAMASVIDLRDLERRQAAQELEEANVSLEGRVAARTLELKERNLLLEHEIEQRKIAEAEIQRYAAELARTNADLEEFSYAVSHDLKAPLRGISGFASMVMEDNSDDLNADAIEYLTIVMQSAEQMCLLIDDLLGLSRITRSDNGYVDVSILNEVREVEAEIAFTLQEKGIALKVADDLPLVHSSPVRIRQILRNLIWNAVKYNGNQNPVIEVGWRQDKTDNYTFFVRDNGKGIDPRYHERIFGIFQRLDPGQETEGTGIGLTICKKAIESLDGAIWVESQPGEGSTFYFSLPIPNTEAPLDQSVDPAGGRQSA